MLEIRPRFGAIGAALRRLYGGETFALPLFEAQQVLVREAYGTCADHLLDYDSFQIPYTGCFDLVVANHLLTHAVRPGETLATIRQRLSPGGHLYLYNEPDEADFLETGKSIFNTLNAFHLQTFDGAALARALQSAGFEPVYIGHHHDNCIALARVAPDGAAWDPISKKELARRVGQIRAVTRSRHPVASRAAARRVRLRVGCGGAARLRGEVDRLRRRRESQDPEVGIREQGVRDRDQRIVNPISSVTSTGTGSPILIPGRNRHSRADAIA